jgi:peptidoglycan L-alanyl-D-glutamate endopeptidase CwlK
MTNDEILSHLYPKFAGDISSFLEEANTKGYKIKLFSGFRSIEEQAKLYSQGRTEPGNIVTKSKPGKSYHNYGLAIDFVFGEDPAHYWDDSWPWDDVATIAWENGLDSGYFWTFRDSGHVQKTYGRNVDELYTLYENGGIENVWKVISS